MAEVGDCKADVGNRNAGRHLVDWDYFERVAVGVFHPEEGTLSVLHVEERGADVGMAAVSQIGVQKVGVGRQGVRQALMGRSDDDRRRRTRRCDTTRET